jgi:D-3-phosphoglycerate dehydrogenase
MDASGCWRTASRYRFRNPARIAGSDPGVSLIGRIRRWGVHAGTMEPMARVLVTEEIAEGGLARLAEAGHEVDIRLGLSPEELRTAIVGADALIIRSATMVDADLLASADRLMVVGRAGIGLDNVDVAAATARGVMVVNAPQSNIVSAAEHTMALILALARNVPQAHTALVAGRWERSRWEGVELADKTLGVVGLGRIGKLVAQRAAGFGMRLIAYDPFVAPDKGRQMGVEMMSLEEVVAEADFLTVHLPKTKETTGIIGAELLARAKPSLRIVNVARGGIVDEAALDAALRSGTVAGAALDVFATEPTTESPLFELDSVVVTPHLGASTREAQDKAGDVIADMVLLALAGDFVPFAVNVDASGSSETLRPFLPIGEQLGRLFATLLGSAPSVLEICAEGDIGGEDTRLLSLSVMKGFFAATSDEPVSYVNAPQRAADRGVEIREVNTTTSTDFVNVVTVRGGGHAIAGTLTGRRSEPRIVMVDDHSFDVPPAPEMLVVRNDDRPGVIGVVGTLLGDAGVNIADMDVGKSTTEGTAMMLIAPTAPVPEPVIAALRNAPGIISVHVLRG